MEFLEDPTHPATSFWNSALLKPYQDLKDRPSKKIRSQLVRLGFLIASRPNSQAELAAADENPNLPILSDILEKLHLGSLIADDIQDGSLERRGGKALHLEYGIPIALNLSNFLYFSAFDQIRKLKITAEVSQKLYSWMTETMMDGHKGQALDLSVCFDEVPLQDLPSLCEKSLQLKSGALAGLAVQMGTLIAGGNDLREHKNFGCELGVFLQMFDDLGNCDVENSDPKKLEDLRNRRLSWVVQFAVETLPQNRITDFFSAIKQMPDLAQLKIFLKETNLRRHAYQHALKKIDARMDYYHGKLNFTLCVRNEIEKLTQQLKTSYLVVGE